MHFIHSALAVSKLERIAREVKFEKTQINPEYSYTLEFNILHVEKKCGTAENLCYLCCR